MRVSRNGRKRKAVLSALAAVREQGMTLVALAHAVDLPEPELLAVLHQLMLTEHVQCVQESHRSVASTPSGASTPARYGLAWRPEDQILKQRPAV